MCQNSLGAESVVFMVHSVVAAAFLVVPVCIVSALSLWPASSTVAHVTRAPTPTVRQDGTHSDEFPVLYVLVSVRGTCGLDHHRTVRCCRRKGLSHFQHHGVNNFLAAASSTDSAVELEAQGSLLLNNVAVPLEQVGPSIICVSVFRLRAYVPDSALQAVLQQCTEKSSAFPTRPTRTVPTCSLAQESFAWICRRRYPTSSMSRATV